MRVPTDNVSDVDLHFYAKTACDINSVNAALKVASAGPIKVILDVNELPLESIDFNHNSTLLEEENKNLAPLRDNKMESVASLQKILNKDVKLLFLYLNHNNFLYPAFDLNCSPSVINKSQAVAIDPHTKTTVKLTQKQQTNSKTQEEMCQSGKKGKENRN